MLVKVEKHDLGDGKFSVDITCKVCGGPITHSDEYGMWCDKECSRKKSVEAEKEMGPILKSFLGMFDREV